MCYRLQLPPFLPWHREASTTWAVSGVSGRWLVVHLLTFSGSLVINLWPPFCSPSAPGCSHNISAPVISFFHFFYHIPCESEEPRNNTRVEFQPAPPDRAVTCLLRSSSMFSFGLRSSYFGEGHPHSLTLLFSHFATVLGACLGSLATCKTLYVIRFLLA